MAFLPRSLTPPNCVRPLSLPPQEPPSCPSAPRPVPLTPPPSSRRGPLPGAVVIERIDLEWRLDPTSPHRIPGATADRRVIVVCNEGYASSLAAATLRDLGVARATDLAGGFRAWRTATAHAATS